MTAGTAAPRPSDPRPETSGWIPPEARVFVQMALFGAVIGAVYWFLTYEAAGSVMLLAFGGASGIAAIAVVLGARRRAAPSAAKQTDGTAPIPNPGWSPLLIGIGLGGLALGAAFGPWLMIAGVLVALLAARSWLTAAMDEVDAARRADRDRGR